MNLLFKDIAINFFFTYHVANLVLYVDITSFLDKNLHHLGMAPVTRIVEGSPTILEHTIMACETNNMVWYMTYEPSRRKTNNVVPNRSDTNRAVQSQKMVRSLKFWI